MSTKEIVPGYQFEPGRRAHILIRLTPIVEELGLERFGLEYIDIDPLFFAPYEDGKTSSSTAVNSKLLTSSSAPTPAKERRMGALWTTGGPLVRRSKSCF